MGLTVIDPIQALTSRPRPDSDGILCLLAGTLPPDADFSAWHAAREQVAIYSAWAAVVWILHRAGHMPMVSSAGSLVGILSMVTGLLVSFRASSSYERLVTSGPGSATERFRSRKLRSS